MSLQSSGRASEHPEIAELGPWFHNLHLPDGTQTAADHPLGDFPRFKWEELALHLPDDLTGQRVLDIGCNAGYYSFELARRGAEVLGIDHDEHYLRQALWARARFGLDAKVAFECLGVYDLGRIPTRFDLIIFMGVLYHLRYPLLALDLVTERLDFDGTLVFQTLTVPGETPVTAPEELSLDDRHLLLQPGWPTMAFVEHRMAGDPTNWWLANQAAVEAMLRSTGLQVSARPGHETWICKRETAFAHHRELDAASGRSAAPNFRDEQLD
jgi:tRNA (mo5U34)-methyltransferase